MASSRIDAADIARLKEYKPISCGFPGGFDHKYDIGGELGKGGFGIVRAVTKRQNGKQYAAKSIKKGLDIPNLSIARQAAHLANIKREVSVLHRLRGTLNVVHFYEALEDDEYVHIIMELCKGGELSHSLATRHYTEKTVSSYLRAVLRTLAQCHSHRILHRDIKPGNFMLLGPEDRSPLKAIDFGLAVFYDAGQLPRTDLGLEGTPWFLAPENLSSEFYPASDIWSAGVMAYQLLSGYLPFDDRRNRKNPALSQVWKAILTQEPDFSISALKDVSQEAKDFMKLLLNKDPRQRPSAKEALKHPWLAGGTIADRYKGKPLEQTVVQRIQRFNQGTALKRTIFELIAQELIDKYAAASTPDSSAHGNPATTTARDDQEMGDARSSPAKRQLSWEPGSEVGEGLAFQGPGGGAIEGPPLLGRASAGSAHGGLEYYRSRGESVHRGTAALMARRRGESVHGGGNYWRIMRAAATAAKWNNRSVRGTHDYVRWVGRSEEERAEQRKAARLCLDTSAHAGSEYRRLVRVLSDAALAAKDDSDMAGGSHHSPHHSRTDAGPFHQPRDTNGAAPAADAGAADAAQTLRRVPMACIPETELPTAEQLDAEEVGRRGQKAYKRFVEATGGGMGFHQGAAPLSPFTSSKDAGPPESSLPLAFTQQEVQEQGRPMRDASAPGSATSAASLPDQAPSTAERMAAPPPASPVRSPWGSERKVSFAADTAEGPGPPPAAGALSAGLESPKLSSKGMRELRDVMRKMHYTREAEAVTEDELAAGLGGLGFRLDPSEIRALLQHMDEQRSGHVRKSAFLASQLDWPSMQTDYREQWLAAARKVFEGLDGTSNGLTTSKLMEVLRAKLPAPEIDYAVEDALVDAGYKDEEEIDFEGFMRILRADSEDSLDNLDQYDARLAKTPTHSGTSLGDDSGHSQMST